MIHEIALEIAAALAEVGAAVGDGPLACTIRKAGAGPETPWDETPAGNPQYHGLIGIESSRTIRDTSGAVISRVRVIIVDATGVEPKPEDQIAVGLSSDQADEDSPWEAIVRVTPNAAGGVALMYEVELAT